MSLKSDFYAKDIECPKCKVKAIRKEIEVFGPNIFIDICPKCNGIWLDDNELKKILKDKKMSDYLTKDIGTQSKSKLICPRCGGLMDIESANDVDVDVCLTCNGVWLDPGELEELKEISKEGFEGDDIEKASERWEDYVVKNRKSRFNRFFRRFGL
jgi:Zn-finger nucleic acid-binding protein